MRNRIHCLVTSSVNLNEKMVGVLFDAACLMLRDSSTAKKFKDSRFEGKIRTSFAERTLGTISGTEFSAEIESELGKGHVKFLVRPIDAQFRNELEWVPAFSMSDLLEKIATETGHPTVVH